MVAEATMALPTLGQDWMTPEEFKSWFVRLGLSQSELGRRLDVKQATISRWLTGERRIEHGGMLRHALNDIAAELERERQPKRRRRRVEGGADA